MPSNLRTPKTLSRWLALDYHRRRTLFAAWWRWVSGGAVLGLLLVGGVLLARGRGAFQAGPVSHPHALFNHDCGKCHQKTLTTLARVWYGDEVGTVTDAACQQCHRGEPHNAPHAGPVGRCVDCHTEHRGHDALVRVADRKCLACHAGLERHDGSASPFARTVSAFAEGGHPPFPRYPDPGTIRFNHALHLAGPLPVMDLKQRRKQEDEARKKGIDPATIDWPRPALKPLACADCHEAEEAGGVMKPIRYEAHCKECHPVGAQLAGPWKGEALKRASVFGREALEHPRPGQGTAPVRASLRDALARFIARNPAFLERASGEAARPLPDRDAQDRKAEAAFKWVGGQMEKIEKHVIEGVGGCRYCHATEAGEVVKPAIPARWWKHARFRHDKHRMALCAECHPGVEHSKDTKDVLLPGLETCLKCHEAGGRSKARAACMDCHAYHDPAKQRKPRATGR